MKTTFNRKIIPKDSILNLYLDAREILETPYSFDLGCCISAIGAILRRSCWVDQVKFKLYPNLSTLVVGHSGIGKDTAIDGAEHILQSVNMVPIIGGRTSETILQKLIELDHDPTCAVILAGELSEFFGPKDYQKGMIETITELMSTKGYKDVSLKGTMKHSATPQKIMRPTLTMMGGSTRDWLHKAMPEAAMSGGFYPRFLIMCESETKRSVPLLKYSISKEEQVRAQAAEAQFLELVGGVATQMSNVGELELTDSAVQAYEKFYDERTGWFSLGAQPYAHRCRDTVLKLAMICAITRFRNVIDYPDIEFAANLVEYVGARIDDALAPPTVYSSLRKEILGMLPATPTHIWKQLEQRYEPIMIRKAIEFLLGGIEGASPQIAMKAGIYYKQ